MITLEIFGKSIDHHFREITGLISESRLYRNGTDPSWFVDLRVWEDAHLLKINLETIPGIRVRLIS